MVTVDGGGERNGNSTKYEYVWIVRNNCVSEFRVCLVLYV
jgi:hypothetical protein